MKKHNEEKRNRTYYWILGVVYILIGIGNIRFLINPDSIYDIILGIVGIGALVGAIFIFKEYKRLT